MTVLGEASLGSLWPWPIRLRYNLLVAGHLIHQADNSKKLRCVLLILWHYPVESKHLAHDDLYSKHKIEEEIRITNSKFKLKKKKNFAKLNAILNR